VTEMILIAVVDQVEQPSLHATVAKGIDRVTHRDAPVVGLNVVHRRNQAAVCNTAETEAGSRAASGL